MNITYSYTILSVDATARCMEVVYTAEGHQTLHVSTRLPYEGEQLEDIVSAYAPLSFWMERTLNVVVPEVGVTGSFNHTDPELQVMPLTVTVTGAQEL